MIIRHKKNSIFAKNISRKNKGAINTDTTNSATNLPENSKKRKRKKQKIYTGPRGGKYVITRNNNKRYLGSAYRKLGKKGKEKINKIADYLSDKKVSPELVNNYFRTSPATQEVIKDTAADIVSNNKDFPVNKKLFDNLPDKGEKILNVAKKVATRNGHSFLHNLTAFGFKIATAMIACSMYFGGGDYSKLPNANTIDDVVGRFISGEQSEDDNKGDGVYHSPSKKGNKSNKPNSGKSSSNKSSIASHKNSMSTRSRTNITNSRSRSQKNRRSGNASRSQSNLRDSLNRNRHNKDK